MPRQTPLEARLAALAGTAEEIIARHELDEARAELDRLREPQKLTTAAGQALALIAVERRAAEREQRARHLRSLRDLQTAELDLKGNAR